MQPDMVFQHFGHQAVDAAAHVCQQHQYVGAIISGGERSLDRIHLATDAFNAGDELLFFFIVGCHFLAYTLGGYGTTIRGGDFPPRWRIKTTYEQRFRTRTSQYRRFTCAGMSALGSALSPAIDAFLALIPAYDL